MKYIYSFQNDIVLYVVAKQRQETKITKELFHNSSNSLVLQKPG